MNIQRVPLSQTKQFPPIVIDYLQGNEKLKPFYNYSPQPDLFADAINNKKKQALDRITLVKILHGQYANASIQLNSSVQKNIDLLLSENTFTITTGHQLSLFTGPLYFIYKIISTINTAKALKEKYSDYNFVPMFWLASEDQDLEEINHIHLFNKTLSCDLGKGMPAGLVSTKLVEPMLAELKIILGESENAKYLYDLFNKAYIQHKNLSDATRFIVHELFKEEGIVIIDGDDKKLKQQFSFVVKDEIENKRAYAIISETNKNLEQNYSVQAKPRRINFFYIENDKRKRIISDDEGGKIENTISVNEVFSLIDSDIEKFSPNVLLRPLYQEIILPNLAYIGGPAEVAYWLELKSLFDYYQIPFPIVMMRNSALFMDKRVSSFKFQVSSWFQSTDDLVKEYVQMCSASEISLFQEKEKIESLYKEIENKVSQIDASIVPSVKAESTKHKNDLEKLEQKLLRAEKRKHESSIAQVKSIKEKLFPNGTMQERHNNFIPYYLKYGSELFSLLKANLNPFKHEVILFF